MYQVTLICTHSIIVGICNLKVIVSLFLYFFFLSLLWDHIGPSSVQASDLLQSIKHMSTFNQLFCLSICWLSLFVSLLRIACLAVHSGLQLTLQCSQALPSRNCSDRLCPQNQCSFFITIANSPNLYSFVTGLKPLLCIFAQLNRSTLSCYIHISEIILVVL